MQKRKKEDVPILTHPLFMNTPSGNIRRRMMMNGSYFIDNLSIYRAWMSFRPYIYNKV